MRLIDADELCTRLREEIADKKESTVPLARMMAGIDEYFVDRVSSMPTVTKKELKRGRWIPHELHPAPTVLYDFQCDVCMCYSDYDTAYCCNCGAEMDGIIE